MLQLNRSMMERYEIAERRPATVRAALFGANRTTLGAAARLLDLANERGGDLGAVCFTPAAEALRAQDCMFTLLVRGERENGDALREERVVQSILDAADPEADPDAPIRWACRPEIELCCIASEAAAKELLPLARFLRARWERKLPPPALLLMGDSPLPGEADGLRAALAALARDWAGGDDFAAWMSRAEVRAALADGLCGALNPIERARAQREMNYRDDFLAWAEPRLRVVVDGGAPAPLAAVCAPEDFALACARKERVFDSLAFLCAATGFLWGADSSAQALRDDALRAFIGQTFFDELLPALPWPREEVSGEVISAFSRLENPMNDVPLLELGGLRLTRLPRTLLPAMRAWAEREFDAPPGLSLALSAAIMLYSGARRNARGEYELRRGDASFPLRDDERVLEAFSRLDHDMPAESLAYAALADRAVWGEDLREIDGLEQRVALDLASIQRVGFRETLRAVHAARG